MDSISTSSTGNQAVTPSAPTRKAKLCAYCNISKAVVKRPKTAEAVCCECFFDAFETEVHNTIIHESLFRSGERVAIGASGGKDSTVLAYVLQLLNEKYKYGLDLVLLSIDEGIAGYRDDSLEAVQRHSQKFNLPLYILPYSELFGWSMDEVVAQEGRRANCTYCGVFRRQALDRGALTLKADKLVTGHNADDIAETVLLNFLRGDYPRLTRCTHASTQDDGDGGDDRSGSCGRPSEETAQSVSVKSLPRVKPFKWSYEKEIVLYAYFKKLDYFATECIYSPEAYRGHARAFLKDIEVVRPTAIVDIIVSGQHFAIHAKMEEAQTIQRMELQANQSREAASASAAIATDADVGPRQVRQVCERCGHMSSQQVCKACLLLEKLNQGKIDRLAAQAKA